MSCEPLAVLHQQAGALTLQEFAEREGLTLRQVKTCVLNGWVLGARKDARSKHWHIYPPAKLMRRPRSYQKPEASAEPLPACGKTPSTGAAHANGEGEFSTCRPPAASPNPLACGSAVAVEAGPKSRRLGQYAQPVEAEGIRPPAEQVFGQCAEPVGPFASPEAKNIRRTLCEAAAQQFREGLHYLRLNAHEIGQLYAALGQDRARVRKLVGRGVLPVGLLRASDSVWQKLQAMSQQGRLL